MGRASTEWMHDGGYKKREARSFFESAFPFQSIHVVKTLSPDNRRTFLGLDQRHYGLAHGEEHISSDEGTKERRQDADSGLRGAVRPFRPGVRTEIRGQRSATVVEAAKEYV
jgi:hypothetical protein